MKDKPNRINEHGMFQIVVFEKSKIVLEGIEVLINGYEDYAILHRFDKEKDLIQALDIFEADILIIDIDIPLIEGEDLVIEILKKKPKQKVLILSNHYSKHLKELFSYYGVKGFIEKNAIEENLQSALNSIIQGKTWFP